MNTYEGPKYYCSPENIKLTLDQYGVAIVPNVLNSAECGNMVDGMFQFVETLTRGTANAIIRTDQRTYKNFNNLLPTKSMILQHWSIGHAQYVWDVRQNKKIVDIFSKLYNVPSQDLLVGFDGSSISFAPEITNVGWESRDVAFHCDQNFKRNEFECIQSWVNGFDTNVGDATLAFLESSNRHHGAFQTRYNITDNADWLKLNHEQKLFYTDLGCIEKRIMCPRGSLVLWDSRTIHTGARPIRGRAIPNTRCVVYACYQPRNLINKANLTKKIKAFEALRTTNHYPCKIKLFSRVPRTYGRDLPNVNNIDNPVLSELGKRLAGFD